MSKDATPVAESVEVTQADRVLFKMIITGMAAASKHMAIDSGGFDIDERMHVIARHRLASYETGRAEGVRAALQSVATIMARMEAIEDEASDSLTGLLTEHETGYHRGEKFTAKSLRRHLHDLTRALSKEPTK